ncbi:MOSC domain-containing protein [Oceaniserpentilla sp. 4NH20-0058]|uniref:MOSC domain-containing protein n=1 Tax=Oceaniserpentilla sp. 4NH20-0058 TaxID=3127660 RepID=UPI0031056E55
MNSQSQLFSRYIKSLPAGELTWVGVRPARKEPMQSLQRCQAIEGKGLQGDHRMGKTPGSGRQVTIISEEFIAQISHYLGGKIVPPELLRRNIVVKNINLNALRYQNFQIGEAIFQAGALCHPCTRMEQALGKGAIAAMMGYGGLCCKVIRGGDFTVGDRVELISPQQALF